MEPRRNFIKKAGALAGVFAGYGIFNQLQAAQFTAAAAMTSDNPIIAASDEDYWQVIQQAYSVPANFINLNNGGVSPSPFAVTPKARGVKPPASLSNANTCFSPLCLARSA